MNNEASDEVQECVNIKTHRYYYTILFAIQVYGTEYDKKDGQIYMETSPRFCAPQGLNHGSSLPKERMKHFYLKNI